jgi:hypothetical protein
MADYVQKANNGGIERVLLQGYSVTLRLALRGLLRR